MERRYGSDLIVDALQACGFPFFLGAVPEVIARGLRVATAEPPAQTTGRPAFVDVVCRYR